MLNYKNIGILFIDWIFRDIVDDIPLLDGILVQV
jgi:hypothetical protein